MNNSGCPGHCTDKSAHAVSSLKFDSWTILKLEEKQGRRGGRGKALKAIMDLIYIESLFFITISFKGMFEVVEIPVLLIKRLKCYNLGEDRKIILLA